jgi:hypothetical protein
MSFNNTIFIVGIFFLFQGCGGQDTDNPLTSNTKKLVDKEQSHNKPAGLKTKEDEYKLIRGVYQDIDYPDNKVANTVLSINNLGKIQLYTYDANKKCLQHSKKGDLSYSLNGKNILNDDVKKEFFISGTPIKWTYNNSGLDKFNNDSPPFNKGEDTLIMGEEYMVTIKKSSLFTLDNIDKHLCSSSL